MFHRKPAAGSVSAAGAAPQAASRESPDGAEPAREQPARPRTREVEAWVPSPCTGVCVLEPAGPCRGCGRTLDEIARWTIMNAAQRRAVIGAASARHASAR